MTSPGSGFAAARIPGNLILCIPIPCIITVFWRIAAESVEGSFIEFVLHAVVQRPNRYRPEAGLLSYAMSTRH